MDIAQSTIDTRCTGARGARHAARHAARRAFSLIEMVVVLLIIGMLVGAVAFNVLGQSEKAKIDVTKRNLAMIKQGIETYMLNQNSGPPTTLQLLIDTKVLNDREFKDEWKRDFQYGLQVMNPDRPYLLWSLGKDGMAGTEDDLDAWTLNRSNTNTTNGGTP